jgi:hypothetical protein
MREQEGRNLRQWEGSRTLAGHLNLPDSYVVAAEQGTDFLHRRDGRPADGVTRQE